MSKVLVCYKWVKDEADIRIGSDGAIDASKAKGKISDYDRNAIEAAMNAAKLLDADVEAVTFGDESSKKSIKDALSRGPATAHWIVSERAENADGAMTASALATAVNSIDDVSLLVCSEGSSDVYARQVGPRVAALLDWPLATCVVDIAFEGGKLVATRKLDDCMQKIELDLPAVVSVLPEINAVPIPGLKAVLAAGKKPVTNYDFDEAAYGAGTHSEVVAEKGYVMDRKRVLIKEGSAQEKAAELLTALKKEGVI